MSSKAGTRTLGDGLEVSALGLGCMSMTSTYGAADPSDAIATIHRALDLGITLLDTADVYGNGENEALVGRAIAGRRDEVVISTKFGMVPDTSPDRPFVMTVDGRPERVAECCHASLRRLDVEEIDLFSLHRVDAKVPVEETVGAMAELVRAGKVRHVGLSEAGAESLRRAQAVHPIAAVQSEWSLFSRDIERAVWPVCRELGIGVVPYSPLGRGFLTGSIESADALEEGDMRRRFPRFQRENLQRNLPLLDAVREIAAEKGCTPGQLALAWLLAQGPHVVPIPGTKRVERLEENAGALSVELDAADLERIAAATPPEAVAGERHVYMEWNER